MLTATEIPDLFRALNDELAARHVVGEIGLCGGAVMCLAYKARASAKKVDAIFAPTSEIRRAATAAGRRLGITEDWLDDAAKGFFTSDPPRENVLELGNLRVWAPVAAYMLAMKCVSARFDSHDRDDVVFLVRHLGLTTPAQVFKIVERYYPRNQIPPKARFLVEEIFESPA
jgi:hypothetical protein